MKDSEALTGVKITTLCPGGVLTPLFDADKIKQYSASEARFLTPDACAKSLLDLLQKKEYPCGSVLEISLSGTRVIPEWNVDPPQGQGTGQEIDEDFINNLVAPIKKAVESDKASKL